MLDDDDAGMRNVDERSLLVQDAYLLARQRENIFSEFTVEQRKAWGLEAAELLRRLAAQLESSAKIHAGVDHVVEWNTQMACGNRPVTFKTPPQWKAPPAPHIHVPEDENDPRGKPPRHLS